MRGDKSSQKNPVHVEERSCVRVSRGFELSAAIGMAHHRLWRQFAGDFFCGHHNPNDAADQAERQREGGEMQGPRGARVSATE